MTRRAKGSGRPVKPIGAAASKPKRRLSSNKITPPASSASSEEADIARLTRERDEARDQQAATSEVLQVISRSQGDLQPVFAAILENAVRLCQASFGDVYSWERDALRLLTSHNSPPAFAEDRRRSERTLPSPGSATARMLATKQPVHIVDLAKEPAYVEKSAPGMVAAVELGGVRTFLGVPMLRENELIGILFLNRRFVRPFTDTQIDLVKNFAAQAVIAIENARLLNELRQRTTDLTERTADLTEALEQQTATSEVLQVISSSPGDLEPVFTNMLEKAVRICSATFGELYRWDGETFQLASMHNTPRPFLEERKSAQYIRPRPNTITGRMLTTKRTAQIADLSTEPLYANERYPSYVAAVELGGVRTVIAVPMIKDDALVGMIMLCRQKVLAFTDKQVALVENFAAEAVIAIENARLLTELRQSLEQQTATADVLKVISSSLGSLEPVFIALRTNATRLCGASYGNLWLCEGDAFRSVALVGELPPSITSSGGGPEPCSDLDRTCRWQKQQ